MFADQWKWEAIDAGNWGSKNLKNLKLKRLFSASKASCAIENCHQYEDRSKCMYQHSSCSERHTHTITDSPTDDRTYGSPWCWLVFHCQSSTMQLCQCVPSKTYSDDKLWTETWICGFRQLSKDTHLLMSEIDTSHLGNMRFKTARYHLAQLSTLTAYSLRQWERSSSIQKTMKLNTTKLVRKEEELSKSWTTTNVAE